MAHTGTFENTVKGLGRGKIYTIYIFVLWAVQIVFHSGNFGCWPDKLNLMAVKTKETKAILYQLHT